MILKSYKDFKRCIYNLQTGRCKVPSSSNYNTKLFFVLLQWFQGVAEEYYCKKIITVYLNLCICVVDPFAATLIKRQSWRRHKDHRSI